MSDTRAIAEHIADTAPSQALLTEGKYFTYRHEIAATVHGEAAVIITATDEHGDEDSYLLRIEAL